jgi:thioesterase domain-containing protein/acyl carrier protein
LRRGINSAESLRGPYENQLRTIWQDILDVAAVAPDDDFFDLGGDSIQVMALVQRVNETFSVSMPVRTCFEASALEEMAGAIVREHNGAHPQLGRLVAVGRADLDGSPFYCVHAVSGEAFPLRRLWSAGLGRPLIAVRSVGLDCEAEPLSTVEEMAAAYLDEIATRSDPPYLLGGFSAGGLVAWEMAQRLRAEGVPVGMLVLFDTELDQPEGEPPSIPELIRRRLSHLRMEGERYTDQHSLEALFSEAVAAGQLGSAVTAGWFERSLEVWARNYAAFWRYERRPYDGDAVFFHAADCDRAHLDAARELVRGRLDFRPVPTPHDDLLFSPFLADQLRSLLETVPH